MKYSLFCIICLLLYQYLSGEQKLTFNIPIVIGGYKYTQYLDYEFRHSDSITKESLLFPLMVDNARIKNPSSTLHVYSKLFNTEETQNLFASYSARFFPSEDLKMKISLEIEIKYSRDSDILRFFWNDNTTYLIIDRNKEEALQFDLGKGLESEISFSNLNNSYRISNPVIEQFDCGNRLAVNLVYWFNLGGEELQLRSLCTENSAQFSVRESSYIKTLNFNNNGLSYFSSVTPFLWYPGSYELEVRYPNYQFFYRKIIVYKLEPNLEMIIPPLRKSLNSTGYMKVGSVLDGFNSSSIKSISLYIIVEKIPQNLNERICRIEKILNYTVENREIHLEFDIKEQNIEINKSVGLILIIMKDNQRYLTDYFDFSWIKSHSNIEERRSLCDSHLADSITLTGECPISLYHILNLQSQFKHDWKYSDESISCYYSVDIMNGVTCCYHKNSSQLVYGDTFYLNPTRTTGSYPWKYSPEYHLTEHILNDRLAMKFCCIYINDDARCSKLWQSKYKIKANENIKLDNRADIIGDPHVFAYNLSNAFSYLTCGEYYLVKSKHLTIQARFYPCKNSFLIGLAVSLRTNKLVVLPLLYKWTNTQWNITFNKLNSTANINVLPHITNDLIITQNKEILSIYLIVSEKSFIYFKLSRNALDDVPYWFINMQLRISGNIIISDFNGILNGYSNHDSSYIFKEVENSKVNTYQDSLFYHLVKKDFEKINDVENTPITINNKTYCKNDNSCNIDANINENIAKETLKMSLERQQLESTFLSATQFPKLCPQLNYPLLKFNSSDLSVNSVIAIVSCINSSINLDQFNVTLTCTETRAQWIVSPNGTLINSICKTDILTTSVTSVSTSTATATKYTTTKSTNDNDDNVLIYSASGGAVALILIVVLIIVGIYMIGRHKRSKVEDSTSQSPIGTNTSTEMSIYDSMRKNKNDDIYATYTEIKKV